MVAICPAKLRREPKCLKSGVATRISPGYLSQRSAVLTIGGYLARAY